MLSRERNAIWRGLSAPKSHASDRRARALVTVESASTCAWFARVVNSAARAAPRNADGVSTSRLLDFSTDRLSFEETSGGSSMILVRPFRVCCCADMHQAGRRGRRRLRRGQTYKRALLSREPALAGHARDFRRTRAASKCNAFPLSSLDFLTSRLHDFATC